LSLQVLPNLRTLANARHGGYARVVYFSNMTKSLAAAIEASMRARAQGAQVLARLVSES
jgi:hypothetical protein